MRTFFKSACVVLLAAWAGSPTALAQTNLPAPATTNRTSSSAPIGSPTNVARAGTVTNRVTNGISGSLPATFTGRSAVSSTATISNPPVPVTRTPSRRYSGKILTVNTNTRIITLQGGEKAGVGITDKTRIIKDKKSATLADLAAGQSVTGMERRDATGKWQAESLNVGDVRQTVEEEPVVIPVAADKRNEATANIHILVPGGASEEEYSFGSLPVQPGIVRTNILTSVTAGSLQGADFVRSIRVDGGGVVAWYPNIADQDIICHVTPGKHDVIVVLKDNNTGRSATVGPLTVTLNAGETQNADFR